MTLQLANAQRHDTEHCSGYHSVHTIDRNPFKGAVDASNVVAVGYTLEPLGPLATTLPPQHRGDRFARILSAHPASVAELLDAGAQSGSNSQSAQSRVAPESVAQSAVRKTYLSHGAPP